MSNFCANNYLGLSSHPAVLAAAKSAIESHGFGLSSVRFICGTQDLHAALERRIERFYATEAAILYSSCFDANGGLFEVLLGSEDAVISDALNHASIIDGIRLCKAERYRYANNDMSELEARLKQARDKRIRMIATDGVFSMDGTLARLDVICELADRYQALVMVDDSHATGFIGPGWPRNSGAPRGGRARRYSEQYSRQSARWGQWRLRHRAKGDRRSLAATLEAVPVLEHAGARGRRR